jgi:sporulation protein YlmC with PRC-barrel domain
MEPQLGRNLAGKDVMSSGGAKLGTLFNITLDLRTGDLKKLLVTPERETPTAKRPQYTTDSHGRYMIPVEHVRSADDYIVVE